MTTAVLDPAFVRELEALRRLLEVRARSGSAGSVTARRRGSAPEFESHRAYAPGDDAARVDWLAFARTGEPVMKQHRADEDAIVRLALDSSRSLDFGEPRKLDVAARLTAAMGYLALAATERVELIVCGERTTGSPPRRGRAAVAVLLRELSAVQPAGGVDLAAAVDRVVTTRRRPGLLVVLSDFLDRGPVTDAVSRARHAGHDVALVQILSPEEVAPDLEGDFSLVDSETEETVELTADGPAVAAYLSRLEALFSSLRTFARRTGATYVRALTTEPLPDIVRRVVNREID